MFFTQSANVILVVRQDGSRVMAKVTVFQSSYSSLRRAVLEFGQESIPGVLPGSGKQYDILIDCARI
jgi:hypothetical protein